MQNNLEQLNRLQQAAEESRRKRDAWLVAFYQLVQETGGTWIGRDKIAQLAELSQQEGNSAEDFWANLGYVEPRTMSPQGKVEMLPVAITTVEDSIRIAADEARA